MADLDRLEIQVESEARRANAQLNSLVSKLERMEGALSRIQSGGITALADGISKFAQASSQLSNVKTSDFTRLTKNIEKLSSLNTNQIFVASNAFNALSGSIQSLSGASASSAQVVELAGAVGRLGGAAVQRAITNLPDLTTGLMNLMTTLSQAPTVSQNVIQMTNALANLSSQGSRVGTAGRSMISSMNGVGRAMSNTTKKTFSLSAAIGRFYASYFMVIRSAKKLWESITASMDYVETLNYFDAAFQQIAESAANGGELAADEYFKSFESKAKELTAKMTGYQVGDNGTLTATGEVSLGINPTQLMNYQAMFAQMSSSIGVTAETSVKLSRALTEIGGDLASVKNMDFDKVWKDMASGLAGMSRTLDKYGVNIRNVNLQEKLFSLGIEEKITNLNQNDKALLRTIILLDSTKYAWGDLADTLNQPANQMRLLQSNMENLGRSVGNLFLPAVSRILPVVNGVTIAIQRLVNWIGNLLGIDLSGITSVGSASYDFSELIDDTDDLADGLDDANASAKKLKANLQGFDELNVISTEDNSGSDSGSAISQGLLDAAFEDALARYQSVWDEAFSNVENRANGFADRIEAKLEPLKNIFEKMFNGDWSGAGEDTSSLVKGIVDFFSEAIDRVPWEDIGNDIGEYLAGLDWVDMAKSWIKLKLNIAKAIWEVFKGSFEEAPIETSVIAGILLLKFTPLGKLVGDGLSKILGGKTLSGFIFGGIKNAFVTTGAEIAAAGGLWNFLSLDMVGLVGEGAVSAGTMIGASIIGGIGASIAGFAVSQWFTKLLMGDEAPDMTGLEIAQELWDGIKKGDIWSALGEWWTDVWDGIKLVSKDAYDAIDKWGNDSAQGLKDDLATMKESFIETKNEWAQATADWWVNDVEPYFTKAKWDEFGDHMKSGIDKKWGELTTWWNGTGFVGWWKNSVAPYFTLDKWKGFGSNVKGGLKGEWGNFTSWWKTTGFYNWWSGVKDNFKKENWTFKGIKDGLGQAWTDAIEYVKQLWNQFANWMNSKLSFSWESFSIAGKEIIPAGQIDFGKIPTFSYGGFPEDGLFMANHGELVGSFANGKTAVANNDQIIAGIEQAAYLGVSRALEEKGLKAEFEVKGDPNGMFKVMQKQADSYHRRTGNPAFS